MIDHFFTRDFILHAKQLNATQHDFLVYNEGIAGKKFIEPADNVWFHRYGSSAFNAIIKRVKRNYTHVYVHWLSFEACDVVLRLPAETKVGSFYWGNDFVEPLYEFKERVFEPETLRYYLTHKGASPIKWRNNPRLKYALNPRWLFNTAVNKLSGSYGRNRLLEKKKKAIARLDYFLFFNPFDLEWVNEKTPTKARLVKFFYPAGYGEITQQRSVRESSAPKVLIGNAASPTLNHLDVIQALSNAQLPPNVEFVLPLSYGDAAYGNYVAAKAKESLKGTVNVLTEYMPREQYFGILDTLTSAVFDIKRSQGLGNVNALLWLGKRVFMHPDCPAYKFYKHEGYAIHAIDEAYSNTALLALSLTEKEANNNREKLQAQFSDEVGMSYLKDILEFKNV